MCGILGLVARKELGFYYKDKSLLSEMLYAGALRGDDSTGLFGVRKTGNVEILKEASCSANFMANKDYDSFLDSMVQNMKFVIGHNRKATKGKVEDKNAHPFYEGDITLVHNGTLFTHANLKENVDVDSHAICHAINERGHQQALNDIKGAYALAWYDNRDKTLRLARNTERPLSILANDEFYFIASEANMLYWLLSRNNILINQEKLKYIPVEPNKIYEFKLEDSADLTIVPLEVLEVTPIPQKKEEKGQKVLPFQIPVRSVNSYQDSYYSKNEITYDQRIHFKFNKLELKSECSDWPSYYEDDYTARFIGTNAQYPNVTFFGYVKEENAAALVDASSNDMLVGTVMSLRNKEGKPYIVTLNNVEVSEVIFSKNGIGITNEIWNSISHHCDICHSNVGKTDIPSSTIEIIRNANGFYRKRKIVCSNCTDISYNYFGDYM